MNAAGRSEHGHVTRVLEDDLARVGDQLREHVGVADGDQPVVLAPDDQRGAGDLGEALAQVVVDHGPQALHEARLAGPAQLLGRERRRQAPRVATTTFRVASRRPGRRATVSDFAPDGRSASNHDPRQAAVGCAGPGLGAVAVAATTMHPAGTQTVPGLPVRHAPAR